MDYNEFETRITKAKSEFLKYKKTYDYLSSFTTVMAVLAPILIAQTSFFILRISGAILLLLNYLITSKMEKYFREWLGGKRYYDFLKLEFFEFQAGLDHYLGLNPEEKASMANKQLVTINEESNAFKEIMDISTNQLYDNIIGLKDKIGTISTNLKELIEKLNTEYQQDLTQLRFEHYIKNRYLDQLSWFYKRINPIKEELKEKDIEKSVYFNFMKNGKISKIFKYITFALTILTNETLLSLIGLVNSKTVSIYIVLVATIASIISSIYSEKDKIQKNSENTLNYLQTAKSLMRLYDGFYTELIGKMSNISGLVKLEHAFVNKTESVLLQENVKWSEIQHTKSD
ncbi:MAG TPA: hypothetical protein VKM55_04060 [Candidatus Lokiarchaeia archaeon]|nr:hypothetical protein [Candidatus Lokiarchaeia archaeon]